MLSLTAMELHGGDIYSLSETLKVPERKIIDFSASVNPLGISNKIKAELRRHLKFLYHYPDNECRRLRRHISRHTGIDENRIVCGNGSTELIYLIVRALGPERVLLPVPTFSEYERAIRTYCKNCRIDYLYLQEDNLFRLLPDRFIEALKDHDMAFICNPNNPTAQSLCMDELKEIIKEASKKGCLLVIDEAFIDFEPENTVTRIFNDISHTIVLRSMTKFYGFAGLRLGYALLPPDIIDTVKRYKEPWTVNSLAQRAGVIALKDNHYRKKTFEYLLKEKQFLEREFRKLGIDFFPSKINFYLLRDDRAPEIVTQLRRAGILVRDCSNFRGLDRRFIRIAVRTHRENAILIKKLKEIKG
ncbi:MAG: threonine-phosphate decarboxylase [Nitrospirae bacterium]|nr:threonine-phosphate decarboxylase [Nitrospirota bacterium]